MEKTITVILFYSDNVPHCKTVKDERTRAKLIAQQNISRVAILKRVDLDTDYHYDTANKYNVRSVPTIIIEHGPLGSGMMTERFVGPVTALSIHNRIYSKLIK